MLIFYDLETTGLNPFHDNIIEFCFQKYKGTVYCGSFNSLINPLVKLPSKIVKITNITDEMLKDKEPFDINMANKILPFISCHEEIKYMIAHNGDAFDRLFLKNHFKRVGINMHHYGFKHIDTVLFARMMYPNFYRYKLGYLIEKLQIPIKEGHRAENDTLMLIDLYQYMCKDLSNRNGKPANFYIENPELVYNMIYN